MSTQRYQHLRQRVSASGKPYHSSIASRSKRDEKMNKEAEEVYRKLEEFRNLGKTIIHVNPNCKDSSKCKPHGETGKVTYKK